MDRKTAARAISMQGLLSIGLVLLVACGTRPIDAPTLTPEQQAQSSTAPATTCAAVWESASGLLVLVEEGVLILQSWDGERCELAEVENGGAVWAAADGRALAWLADGGLKTLDLRTGETGAIPIGGDLGNVSPAVEWDGDRIAIVRQERIDPGMGMPEPAGVWELSLIGPGASEPEVLYRGPVAAFPCLGECPDMAPLDVGQMGWSYDGRLAISVSQFLAPAAPALQAVWLIDVDSLDAEAVLLGTGVGDVMVINGGAVLSPNGAMIAYLPLPSGPTVVVQDLASGELSRIEMPTDVGIPAPDTLRWSADSQRLGFRALDWMAEGRREGIAVIDLESSAAQLLLEDSEARLLEWCGSEWVLLRSGTDVTARSLAGAETTWTLAEGSWLEACVPPS